MTAYVALLRAVNLGKRQLRMEDLKRIAEELGLGIAANLHRQRQSAVRQRQEREGAKGGARDGAREAYGRAGRRDDPDRGGDGGGRHGQSVRRRARQQGRRHLPRRCPADGCRRSGRGMSPRSGSRSASARSTSTIPSGQGPSKLAHSGRCQGHGAQHEHCRQARRTGGGDRMSKRDSGPASSSRARSWKACWSSRRDDQRAPGGDPVPDRDGRLRPRARLRARSWSISATPASSPTCSASASAAPRAT